MSHAYNEKSKEYLNFLASENGKIQQEVLTAALLKHLPTHRDSRVLDAACGPGWLTKKLSEKYPAAEGFDVSEEFIRYAKKEYLGLSFKVANIIEPLPYPESSFDSVLCNMALVDVPDLPKAFKNLFLVTKQAGSLLVTLPNPYYTFPVAVWKRGLLGFLLGHKPKLKIKNPYNHASEVSREFNGQTIGSYFYPLSDYLNAARTAGFQLTFMEELKSETDSDRFNLRYQLYRYPLILLLEFGKPGK